jgi:lysophospholipase L1-like esterase
MYSLFGMLVVGLALLATPPAVAAPSGGTAPTPGAACAPASKATVLAFGDSLTNGAVPSLQRNHPYTLKLGQLLQAELGRPVDIKTVGEAQWAERLPTGCSPTSGRS